MLIACLQERSLQVHTHANLLALGQKGYAHSRPSFFHCLLQPLQLTANQADPRSPHSTLGMNPQLILCLCMHTGLDEDQIRKAAQLLQTQVHMNPQCIPASLAGQVFMLH